MFRLWMETSLNHKLTWIYLRTEEKIEWASALTRLSADHWRWKKGKYKKRELIDRKHKQNGFVTSKLLRLIFSPIPGYSSFAIHLNKWIGSIHYILHLESNRKICLRIHDLITSYNCIPWFERIGYIVAISCLVNRVYQVYLKKFFWIYLL